MRRASLGSSSTSPAAQARRVPIDRRTPGRHQPLPRRNQCRAQALRLDRAPRPDHRRRSANSERDPALESMRLGREAESQQRTVPAVGFDGARPRFTLPIGTRTRLRPLVREARSRSHRQRSRPDSDQHLDTHCKMAFRLQRQCHFYFARRVTFLPCADNRQRRKRPTRGRRVPVK
jgi:hypothetical protein